MDMEGLNDVEVNKYSLSGQGPPIMSNRKSDAEKKSSDVTYDRSVTPKHN